MAYTNFDKIGLTGTGFTVKATNGNVTTYDSPFIGILEASIAYTDAAVALGTIPTGAKIYSITIVATTGFNGTTPTYDVGFTADANAVVAAVALPSAAGYPSAGVVPPAATATEWATGVTSGVLIGTFAGGGSNTTGAGKIRIVWYK